jgi:general secretion pathway protein A
VRLLSNVETAKRKLLQIVLIGQPELDQRLAQDGRLRALQQRIAVRYRIQPLRPDEVAEYVRHRLQTAGSDGTTHFTTEALFAIARLSEGVPRRINLLCDQALVAGFIRESRTIDESMVDEASGIITTAVS